MEAHPTKSNAVQAASTMECTLMVDSLFCFVLQWNKFMEVHLSTHCTENIVVRTGHVHWEVHQIFLPFYRKRKLDSEDMNVRV